MSNALISVVIPAMNRANVIERAVNSALEQTIPVHEIIIVDDGSTDDSIEVIKKMPAYGTKIKLLLNETNMGAPYSRNKGAAQAEGEFIAFLDSDDRWLPSKLEKQMSLQSSSGACAVFTNFVFIRNGTRQLGQVKEKVTLADLFGRNVLGATSSLVVKKAVFEEVSGFTQDLPSCQDWDLYLRLAQKTDLYCLTEPLVEYHIDGGQRISTNKTKAIRGHEMIFSKISELMSTMDNMKIGKREIKAKQSLRLAEIHIKNLNQKKQGFASMKQSIALYPAFNIMLGNLKLVYFLLFR